MRFGLRASLEVYRVSTRWGQTDLLLEYFGVDSIDGGEEVRADAVSSLFFNTVPADPKPQSNLKYSTSIYSGDFNLRFLSDQRFRPILGLRYVVIDETFDAFQDGTGNVSRIGGFSETSNRLFGGQIGAEIDLYRGQVWGIYSSAKLGALQNRIRGSASAKDVSGSSVTKPYGTDRSSMFADSEIGLECRAAAPLCFRVGYQFLWFDRVATGIDQNGSVNLLSPGETVVLSSQQYHGLNFSAAYEF
jgi:hypothetical protein